MPEYNKQQYITEFHPDIIKAVPALPAAASYPANRFHRTSDHEDYYSDGTRWLSIQKKYLVLGGQRSLEPFPQAVTIIESVIPEHTNGVYIEKINCGSYHNTAQSGINYYSFSANMADSILGGTGGLGGTANTSTFTTANRYYEFDGGIVVGAAAAKWFTIQAVMTPTGAPGTFFFWATAVYRLIG
jgi:hypothetical protein